jgi:HTH-type transcriptional regulator / antitoxin HigA
MNYRLTKLKTEEDNERAISQLEVLAHQDTLTAAEEDLLERLTQLIEHFEEEHYAFAPEQQATPLDRLLFLMESNHLKQSDLVGIMGSKGVVSEVINGKRGISKGMAIALGNRFNVDAGFFLT